MQWWVCLCVCVSVCACLCVCMRAYVCVRSLRPGGVCVCMQVEMQLPAAGWGVMNITSAGLTAWSFTETVTFAAQPTHPKASVNLPNTPPPPPQPGGRPAPKRSLASLSKCFSPANLGSCVVSCTVDTEVKSAGAWYDGHKVCSDSLASACNHVFALMAYASRLISNVFYVSRRAAWFSTCCGLHATKGMISGTSGWKLTQAVLKLCWRWLPVSWRRPMLSGSSSVIYPVGHLRSLPPRISHHGGCECHCS